MKKLLFTFLIGLSSITLFANGNIEKDIPFVLNGAVIDAETNEPMTGVEVLIGETGEVVYTDFDGKFTYTTPINGSYHLTFSMISFEDQKREFSIENNNLTVKF